MGSIPLRVYMKKSNTRLFHKKQTNIVLVDLQILTKQTLYKRLYPMAERRRGDRR